MPFEKINTLTNQDSEVKIDVETLARLEFSDIEYLLKSIDSKIYETRLERILYEDIISKLAGIFQLAMRAYKYLEKPELEKELINTFTKSGSTDTGRIGKYREDLFHDGIHFFDKTIFYPFGKFEGRGFKGMHIKKGAHLNIIGVWEFNSKDKEYAITSEGVFEIDFSGTTKEKWVMIDKFPTISAIDFKNIQNAITKSIHELKKVWSEISKVAKQGDGSHSYTFLNENGSWELIEQKDGKNTVYNADSKKLEINGSLTITPAKNMVIRNNNIRFE